MFVSVIIETIEYANTFEAPADAKEDAVVRIACYYAQVEGTPCPCQEIEELKWVSMEEKDKVIVTPTTPLHFIIDQLINSYEMATYITVSSSANLSASTVSTLSLL